MAARRRSESDVPIIPTPAVVPRDASLAELARAAKDCKGCPLYANATQTVFGEGTQRARIVIVGEQPGDAEDKAGRPFVGPAGQILDRALEQAGIDRHTVYVTNAVKHFNFEFRGNVDDFQKARPFGAQSDSRKA